MGPQAGGSRVALYLGQAMGDAASPSNAHRAGTLNNPAAKSHKAAPAESKQCRDSRLEVKRDIAD